MKRKNPEEIFETLENEVEVDDIDLDEEFNLDEEDTEEELAPKPKRKPRAPRKRKPPTLSMSSVPAEVSAEPKAKSPKPFIDEEKTEVIEVKAAPKAEAKKTELKTTQLKTSEAPVAVEFPKTEATPAPALVTEAPKTILVAPTPTADPASKDWGAFVSASVSENLQQVASQLKELQANYQAAIQDAKKQSTMKPALLSRIAMGASAIAMVFSFISFSLSQSARQTALSHNVFPKEAAFEQRITKSEPKAPRFEPKFEPKAEAKPPVEKRVVKKETPEKIEKPATDKRLSAALLREKAISALAKEKTPKKKSLAKKTL